MSCSASSNIRGQASIINPQGSNARTFININSSRLGGSTIGAGMTPGAVVRFDWTVGGLPSGSTGTYVRSKADNNENAEVVGVVESNDNGEITIVTNGYINIPNDAAGSMFTYPTNPETGQVNGASGGNDIWFLSAITAGHLQNLEPTGAGQVVKPVLQKIAHPDYNYQVINYIGYAVAGDVLAENLSYVPIGSYQRVPDFIASKLRAESGYVDASVENVLDMDEYKDFYDLWKDQLRTALTTAGDGERYFYEVVVDNLATTDHYNGLKTALENGYDAEVYDAASCAGAETSLGTIVKAEDSPDTDADFDDTPDIKITASRLTDPGGTLPTFADFQFTVKYDSTGDGVLDQCSGPFNTRVVSQPVLTHFGTFRTPIILDSSTTPQISVDGVALTSFSYRTILKVKENGAITAPQKLFIDNLKATGLTAAGKFSIPNYTDVEATLTSYGNRITTLEGG